MKAYVKPELFYESYELSQHVAACVYDFVDEGKVNQDPASCEAVDAVTGLIVFASGFCANTPEGYCYTTTLADTDNTFDS